MAHATARSGYRDLVERLNRFPQGAPPSDLLYRILALLFTEREAGLVALLPVKPFTLATAARAWKTTPDDARKTLDALAARALLLDAERDGETRWVLPPPMAGFFEFSMMRVRDDIDQKALAELFFEYLNVEDDFVRELFARGETQLGRAFVNEDAVPDDDMLHVLDWERASEVARTARAAAVGVCYCRHKMTHVGRACDAPLEICLTFGNTADSLSRHGFARRIDAAEALDLLAEARSRGLVQFGENVTGERRLRLQLLRLLLRGAPGAEALRRLPARPDDRLPSRGRRRTVQRLRGLREGVPRRRHDAPARGRPEGSRAPGREPRRQRRASAAASASPPAGGTRFVSSGGRSG